MIGREAELDLVLGSVGQVPTAGLVAVVVSGEPGIGKSSLLTEVAERLGGRGWQVLAVPADRLERHVPYAALAAAIRTLSADNTFTEGVRREALTALDTDGSGAAFGRACAAVTRLCTALSAAGPLAIVVDDLPELDDDCLTLFAVVLRRLSSAPIGLIIAARTHLSEPNTAADEMLDRLADQAELVRVELGTLSPKELAEVVTPVLGTPPDEDLAAEIHRRADGNPFFATEIARSLVAPGLVGFDAVLRRVVPPTPRARAVARTLAVLRGVELRRIGLVAEVAALPERDVAGAFDELVRTHVLVRDGERYRFSHPIVADALYDEIGPAERRRLHGLVAQHLGTEDALELAWHVAESAAPGDAAAAAVLAEAARQSLARAPEAAARFCERALALQFDGAPERAGLLALRCRALARASRPVGAVVAGRSALAILPVGDERRRTATAVIGSLFLLGRIDEAIEVADEQIAIGDAPAALHAQRAVLLVHAGRRAEALQEAAVASAAVVASPAEEVVVCAQLAMLTSMVSRHAETVRYADRALRASGDSTTLKLQALAVCASTEALAGLVPDATRRLRQAQQLAGEVPLFRGELGLTRVVLDWLGGRWDTALEGVRTVGAELAMRQQATLAAALTAVELEVRTWRGELELAARLAGQPVPALPNMADLHVWALAGFQAASGDREVACATLRSALVEPTPGPYGCLLLARLIELVGDRGPSEVDALLSALVEEATPLVSPWSKTTLSRTVGVVRRDAGSLGQAVAEAEAGGLVFERALAQLALGELDADAVPALVEAYGTFARVGAHGLRRRAGRRLHELGAKVPRARPRAAGLLTESEERVARLVQQGMRNREIASALHYSPRSIEVYLSRIYAKLRVSSRLELARALDALDARAG